jgi:hypothetical protein
MTSNGRGPQISKEKYFSNQGSDHMTKPYFENHLNEDNLQWKTTLNIKRKISQQPLVRSTPNF